VALAHEARPAEHQPVLDVRDLRTYFYTRRGVGRAVDGIDLQLYRDEVVGLVGESGSGKSIAALSIIGLHPRPAARIIGGEVLLHGEDLVKASPRVLRKYRGKRIAMVFQDPMTALNPLLTIGSQVGEPLRLHEGLGGSSLRERVVDLLRMLRIPTPERLLGQYPHQFSGGMRQRVVSATALSCHPDLLIADEPTTSLDVTIQAAYLALLRDIQRRSNLAVLFITHDFGVVAKTCDRVAVMYAGKIVETAPTRTLFAKPAHPYTEALLNSVPDVRHGQDRLISIEGRPPSIYELPVGCAFAPRCPYVMPRCTEEFPPQVDLGDGQRAACWRHL
jgi:oligopeptide/dipeptide ABC transporter ATP-binding protein